MRQGHSGMDQRNVQSKVGVTLVGGGVIHRKDLVDSVALAPILVAADGGANACFREGFVPKTIIGDFDSILPETVTGLTTSVQIKVEEQDSTDFEKCLSRIAAPFVLAVGFTGNRLDHLLAVFSVMARHIGPPVILVDQTNVVFFAQSAVTLDLAVGTPVSLFPFAPVSGRAHGLKWPIDGLELSPVGQISTSNEATGPVTLELENPGCAVILPRHSLETAIMALPS